MPPRSCSCSMKSMVAAPFVHFTDLVALAGVVKDTLGGRGLAGVDVRHDAEIAIVGESILAGHNLVLVARPVALVGRLPAIMGEGAVGFGHAMRVFTLLDGVAAVVRASISSADRRSFHGLVVAAARALR